VRHVRMLGLCLVAVFAVCAYAVSSATAGPTWVKCEKVGPGHNYTGPNCTKAEKAKPKGTGEYELRKAPEVSAKRVAEGKSANIPFSGGSVGGGGVLTTGWWNCLATNGNNVPGETQEIGETRQQCAEGKGEYKYAEFAVFVECENEASVGEVEGTNKVANVHVTFKGCNAYGIVPCTGSGLAEGEIKTNTLKGELGYPEPKGKEKHEAAIVLEPVHKKGLFTSFICPGVGTSVEVGEGGVKNVNNKGRKQNVWYTGPNGEYTGGTEKNGGYDQIISPITPTNEMTSKFRQVYSTEEVAHGVIENIPRKFEGKHISQLETVIYSEPGTGTTGGVWGSAGEAITNEVTSEEAGEIEA